MNYPGGIKKNIITIKDINKDNINYKNRGMNLEEDLNITNRYYKDQGIAYIYKKPTPIKVVKANFENGKRVITEAYYSEPSTTDYNGIYKGNYIDYEAKETKNKNNFPLSNIHKHQIEHIRNIVKEKGICFLIIRFTSLNKTYLLKGIDLLDFIDKNQKSSIPFNYIEEKGYQIKEKYLNRLDYLEIIDKIWRKL